MTLAAAQEEMREILENTRTFGSVPPDVYVRYVDLACYTNACEVFNFFARTCPRTMDKEASVSFWMNFRIYASNLRNISDELQKMLAQEEEILMELSNMENERGNSVSRFYIEYTQFSKRFFALWVRCWNTTPSKGL